MSSEDQPAYLRAAVQLITGDLERIQVVASDAARSNRYYSPEPDRLRAMIATVPLQGALLSYGEVRGVLINAAGAGGSEVVVGSVMSGSARVYLNGESRTLVPGQSLLALPGDAAVQVLQDYAGFTLRLSVSHGDLIRITARPFAALRTVSRWLAPVDSLDIIHLLQFAAIQHDRRRGDPDGGEPQIAAVGRALVERARRLLTHCLGPPRDAGSTLMDICRACDAHITTAGIERLSAQGMARASNCSVRQLFRAFEAVADVTPLEYQLRSRLRQTRVAILDSAESDKPIAELARNHGFASTSRFTRAYLTEFGETPADTRANRERLLSLLLGKSDAHR